MLVLSALVILTSLLVEFAYNTNVNYSLAQNERDRLKAYYLAKSAYNFMLLELKFDKQFQSIVQSQNLGQYLGDNAQMPLCQQFPLSTSLIRTVFTGGGIEGLMGGGTKGEGTEGGEEQVSEEVEQMQKDVSVTQEKSAEEFLAFEGDFDGECVNEGTKINLNTFAGLSHVALDEGGVSPFDQYKRFLYKFLSNENYVDLFKNADVTVSDVVDNIGDWIDPDVEMNKLSGGTGGAERSLYDRLGVGYRVRNGKLLTLIEAYLIDGVKDDWFEPMEQDFTVYGDGKINICTASKDVVDAMIYSFVESTPGLPTVRLDNKDEMEKFEKAVDDACAMGVPSDQLGATVEDALKKAATGGVAPEGEAATTPGQTTAGQSQGFASTIGAESRFFNLKLTGQVMDVMVRVNAVLDVKDQDPKKWKLLYWRVY